MGYVCNSSIQEAEAGGSVVQDQQHNKVNITWLHLVNTTCVCWVSLCRMCLLTYLFIQPLGTEPLPGHWCNFRHWKTVVGWWVQSLFLATHLFMEASRITRGEQKIWMWSHGSVDSWDKEWQCHLWACGQQIGPWVIKKRSWSWEGVLERWGWIWKKLGVKCVVGWI